MKEFSELVDSNIFVDKKVAVVENSYANATFMIEGLLKLMNLRELFSFYKDKAYYNHIEAKVKTIFESEYVFADNVIIDDFYTAQMLFDICVSTGVCIYRSNSFNYKYARDFDLLILVSPLESGFSTVYDGIVRIVDRDRVYYEFKYKIDGHIGLLR